MKMGEKCPFLTPGPDELHSAESFTYMHMIRQTENILFKRNKKTNKQTFFL